MCCFSKGTDYAIEELADAGYDMLSLDWRCDPAEVTALSWLCHCSLTAL
jgi:uroporphyrinogen-III decarboxylase